MSENTGIAPDRPPVKPAESPCLAAALDYLARGWSPVPLCPPDHAHCTAKHIEECKRPGKVPLGPWKGLQERAAPEVTVRKWWERNPHANVGVALGPVSGLVALDIDGEAGEQFLDQVSGGDLPPTLEFITGRGRRYLFRWPEGIELKNEEYPLGPGEELRVLAKGRQTVMPPSVHANGTVYRWEERRGPEDIQAAECPDWLLKLLCPEQATDKPAPDDGQDGQESGGQDDVINSAANHSAGGAATGFRTGEIIERAAKYLEACEPCVAGRGTASNHCFKIAVKLVKGFGLDPETAARLMYQSKWNGDCTHSDGRPYPWELPELRHKCQDAAKEPNPEGFLRDQPRAGLAETITRASGDGGRRVPAAPSRWRRLRT